jgi:hypothetical protein
MVHHVEPRRFVHALVAIGPELLALGPYYWKTTKISSIVLVHHGQPQLGMISHVELQ